MQPDMCASDNYQIDLSVLEDGVHHREFHLDDAYFDRIGSDMLKGGSVDVALDVYRTGKTFKLDFHSNGEVTTTCDICLDDMQQPIDTDGSVIVRFGQEAATADDDSIVMGEGETSLDLSWLMYEQIALAVPIRHVHAPGACNAAMAQKLEELTTPSARGGEAGGEAAVDPRWEKLKGLKIKD